MTIAGNLEWKRATLEWNTFPEELGMNKGSNDGERRARRWV